MSFARTGALAAVLVALLCTGCGKPAQPRVDAATEQAQATERAKKRDYGGREVTANENAKKMADDMNRKAELRDPDAK